MDSDKFKNKKESNRILITKEQMLEIIKKENLESCGFSVRFRFE